jgi:hypothetical protein
VRALADVVCVAPEGTIHPPTRAQSLVPEYSTAYVESAESDGRWWLIIGESGPKALWVYAIPQTVISWPVPENSRAIDFTKCVTELHIANDRGVPVLTLPK